MKMSIIDHQGERDAMARAFADAINNKPAIETEPVRSPGMRIVDDPRHKAYQPSHGRHRDWYYVDDLTAERVADVLSDLKPKQRKAAKVAGYHRSLDAVRFVVWYPAKG